MSQLELTVAELEDSLVEDYGLIKRCRTPTFEHGVASCNHLGKLNQHLLGKIEAVLSRPDPG